MTEPTPFDTFICYLQKNNSKDEIIVKRKKSEVILKKHESNKKTIYRLITPKSLNLNTVEDDCTKSGNANKEITSKSSKRKQSPEGLKRKICKNRSTIKESVKSIKTKNVSLPKMECKQNKMPDDSGRYYLKTRSGQNSLLNSKIEEPADKICKENKTIAETTNYTNNSINTPSSPKTKSGNLSGRSVNSKYVCPTCKKVFLGRRLQRHYVQHPNHIKLTDESSEDRCGPAGSLTEKSLFGYLISKLQNSNLNEDQRAELFLKEINDFVHQLHLCSYRLLRNTSGLHLITANISRLLGIPEGHYTLDMSAISNSSATDTAAFDENYENLNGLVNLNSQNLDYPALNVSLDHTLTDEAAQKLNLSAGGNLLPPSEESLLRAVNDFVQNDIKPNVPDILKPTVPHYDHVSDNAVEAVSIKETHKDTQMLDLAVDFFSI